MAAARRGRGNGWTVGAPKMPAALCAPAAGGRRLHHALWSGGEARRAGTCPLSLPSPPPPAFARVRPRPRSPPPISPAAAGAPARLCRRALCGRLPHARPAGGGGSRLPPQACRRVVPGAAGETDRRRRGESKAHFQARGLVPEAGGAHSVPGQPAAPRAGRLPPPSARARGGRGPAWMRTGMAPPCKLGF